MFELEEEIEFQIAANLEFAWEELQKVYPEADWQLFCAAVQE